MKVADFFPDITVYKKLQDQNWKFDIETWQKDGEPRFALKYKSPRMSKFEITDLENLFEPSLREEEAWALARDFMDKNLMFQMELKQKMLDLFRHNRHIDPDKITVEIKFNTTKQTE